MHEKSEGKEKLELNNFEFKPPNDDWLGGLKNGSKINVVLEPMGGNFLVKLQGEHQTKGKVIWAAGKIKPTVQPSATTKTTGIKMGIHAANCHLARESVRRPPLRRGLESARPA
jgi:hypothetical protein